MPDYAQNFFQSRKISPNFCRQILDKNDERKKRMKTIMKLICRAFAVPAFACFVLSHTAKAVVPPPDGGYPGGNTAEGQNALFTLTTGAYNTAVGFFSLRSNTEGKFNTGTGAGTLLLNTADNNTATGAGALFSNTTGVANTANGAFALFGNTEGNGNTASGYQALFSNDGGDNNTGYGYFALHNHNIGDFNTAIGSQTLVFDTDGDTNTAIGYQALVFNTIGSGNTATGVQALESNTTGVSNTADGLFAMISNTTGGGNTASGAGALFSNSTAFYNVAFGDATLFSNTTGSGNTAFGTTALQGNTTGNYNIALGFAAGNNLDAGDNNIYIGNLGAAGESNTIRIGGDVDTGYGSQTAAFIAGISGTAVVGDAVVVDGNGQLGTVASAARFKKEVRPIGKTSEAILALKPVSFEYKSDTKGTTQFGLIAEEVAKVNQDLVIRDRNGEIYSVRYEAVNAMLLNEFLKEHRTVQEQQKEIDALRAELKEQRAFIQKVNDKVELSRPAPQTVLNNQ